MPITRLAPTESRDLVVALHCSGANAAQWRKLSEALGTDHELVAPEHYGCESVGPWTGEHAFSLADEAARTIALIDRTGPARRIHLVGHSYGGGVALHVALARPERIASLTLYEPSAFHLLRQFEHGQAAFDEIRAIALAVATGVITGEYRPVARRFVDYWSGAGTWDAMRPAAQGAMASWMPKAPLDFHALFGEPTPITAYTHLHCPTLVMCGEYAPAPTRVISELLLAVMPQACLAVVAGAGHMGPISHAPVVVPLMARHIAQPSAVRAERRAA